MKMSVTIIARYQLIAFAIILFLLTACSSKEVEPQTTGREVASHIEETGVGSTVIKVYEERRNGIYIIKVVILKDGKRTEQIHHFDNNNFEVSVPVSARIMVQSTREAAQSSSSPDTGILVFSQQLEVAREAMMKTDYVGALEALNEALKIDSYNPQAHMMKGSIFYAMGKYDLAKKEFDFVLKVDPQNMEVKKFKEFMESKSENIKKVKIEGIEEQ